MQKHVRVAHLHEGELAKVGVGGKVFEGMQLLLHMSDGLKWEGRDARQYREDGRPRTRLASGPGRVAVGRGECNARGCGGRGRGRCPSGLVLVE